VVSLNKRGTADQKKNRKEIQVEAVRPAEEINASPFDVDRKIRPGKGLATLLV
jgi:hypothetical protein